MNVRDLCFIEPVSACMRVMLLFNCPKIVSKELLDLARADIFPDSTAVSPADREQVAAAYAGYRVFGLKLIRFLEMIVSPAGRGSIRSVLENVLLRMVELRKCLVTGVSSNILEMTDVLEGLRIGPEAVDLDDFPNDFLVDRARLNHLLSLFSEPKELFPDTVILDELEDPSPEIQEKKQRKFEALSPCASATRIASIYRGIVARRKYREFLLNEYRFLGLLPDPVDAQLLRHAESVLRTRAKEIQRLGVHRCEAKSEELKKIKESAELEMKRTFRPESLIRIWKFKDMQGRFPDSIQEALHSGDKKVKASKEGKKESKPATRDKKAKPAVVVSVVPKYSAVKELVRLLENFDLSRAEELVSSVEAQEVHESVKRDMLLQLNGELSAIRIQNGLNAVEMEEEKSSAPQYEEQDLIDLIKEGIVKRVEKIKIVGNKYMGKPLTGTPPTVNQLRVVLMDECIIPLSFPLVASNCFASKSVLLFGPKDCGKTTLVHYIVSRSNAVLFDLTGKLSLKKIDQIVRICPFLGPCVVLIDNIADKMSDSIAQLIERLKLMRVLVVCTTNAPSKLKQKFDVRLFVNFLTELDRAALIHDIFHQLGFGDTNQMHTIAVLARVTEGFSTLSIKQAVRSTLKQLKQRVDTQENISPYQFVSALSRIDRISLSEYTAWKDFSGP